MEKEKAGTGMPKHTLADMFPIIRTRNEIRDAIAENPELENEFLSWNRETQEVFLDFCSGEKGVKIVYDGVFKEIFNPETAPERLEGLLSALLGHEVIIEAVLPNDSVRLGAESSLLYTDLIVQQKDGSLSNVEIQKIGYSFPGERSACYSADHLLRQYKRVRGERGKHFTYRDIKRVYTIVIFERSPKEFRDFPEEYLHAFHQDSNTGMELELLQEYCFVPLDVFRRSMENRTIENELEAWLSFLAYDDPERILELITRYPAFKAMYGDIYEMCLNMERVMSMYSKELAELDRNTVRYMIDEMQAELDEMQDEKQCLQEEVEKKREEIEKKRTELERSQSELERSQSELERSQSELERSQSELERSQSELRKSRLELAERDRLIETLKARLIAAGDPDSMKN